MSGGTGQHIGMGLGGSMHSAWVFEQGVGNGPAREGGAQHSWYSRFQAPASLTLVASAPPPHTALLALLAPRPLEEGVRIVPSPSWSGCPDAAGDCPGLGLQTSIWRRTLCPGSPYAQGPRA